MLNVGCFGCRSSISIDKLLKPLPAIASEETESLAFALSCSKRMRKEDAGGDLGHAEEEDRSSQVEAGEVEGSAAKFGCQGTAAADATADAGITAEAGPARTEEAGAEEVVATGVIMPRIATDEVAAGEAATTEACSGLAN
jgi:hypothetical protein